MNITDSIKHLFSEEYLLDLMATGLQPVFKLLKRDRYCTSISAGLQISNTGLELSKRVFNIVALAEDVMTLYGVAAWVLHYLDFNIVESSLVLFVV